VEVQSRSFLFVNIACISVTSYHILFRNDHITCVPLYSTHITECNHTINIHGKFYFHIDSRSSKWEKIIAIGATVFVLCVIFMILGILRWKGFLGGKISRVKGNKYHANLDVERIKKKFLQLFE
jgi:hypothetical protein